MIADPKAGARERAQRIVSNWRVNFDPDDDRPLVNMIEAALLPATDAIAGGQGLREKTAEIIAGFPRAFRAWHSGNHAAWQEAERKADAVLALPELAALIANAARWRQIMYGDPTQPLPTAMQMRDLLLQVRRVEALANTLGEEATVSSQIERAVAALRIYGALRGEEHQA